MKKILFCIIIFTVMLCSLVIAGAPSGLSVTQNGDITQLQWSTSADATSYNVYHSTGAKGKFNAFPGGWTVIATVLPTPTYTTYSYEDTTGNTYTYYLVTAMVDEVESDKSTMGVKTILRFTYAEGTKNTYRISLPYISGYTKASDVVSYLEGGLTITPTKINNISFWIPETQSFVPYGYKESVENWIGTDWVIEPYGLSMNAMYLHILSSFDWIVVGTDISVPLVFTHNPVISNNNKRMIPYTSTYSRASDIVSEIEGSTGAGSDSKINKIALWNPISQSYIIYGYDSRFETWVGTNFDISPGEALNIFPSGNTASFTWSPALETPVIE